MFSTRRAIEALSAARSRLNGRTPERARHLAQHHLAGAVERRDRYAEAHCCLLVAEALTAESRFNWARRFASRADSLFEQAGDLQASLRARFLIAYAESASGHDDVAHAIATRAVAAAADARSHQLQAAALNYFGVTSFWMRQFGTARGVLDASGLLAGGRNELSPVSFQPTSNACFTEVLRVVEAECQGAVPDLGELTRVLQTADRALNQGAASLTSANPTLGILLVDLARCIVACRSNDAAAIDSSYEKCSRHAARLPPTSWGHAVLAWSRAEVFAATRGTSEALSQLRVMERIAVSSEHRHFAAVGRRLRLRLRHRTAPGRSWESATMSQAAPDRY